MMSFKREAVVSVVVALFTAPLIIGCGKKEAVASAPPASAPAASASSQPDPSSAASVSPALVPAASALSAEAPPAQPASAPAPADTVLATQDYNDDPNLKMDLLQVKRVSGGALLIKWRMAHRGPQGSKAIHHSWYWENVYFTDPAENKKYLGLKDSTNNWIAQGDGKVYNPGDQQVVWMKFPAPPASSNKITVVFSGFPPFEDVPVSP